MANIHILHPAAIHHAARRSDLQPIIEYFHMNLRTKNLVIPVNQCVDQHLTNGLIRVIAVLLTGHAPNAPRIFAIVPNKILCILQQGNQTCTLKFFIIQGILVQIALSITFPPSTENA